MTKENLHEFFKNRHFHRSIVVSLAGILMHYTPDYIDDIIKILLVMWGVTDLKTAVSLSGSGDVDA